MSEHVLESDLDVNRKGVVSMRKWIAIFVPVLALVTYVSTTAQTLPEGGVPDHKYVGADKCKFCHNSEKKGAQYSKWQETKHAKAYESLASEEAQKIAAERGLGNPQEAGECLVCHVTGYAAPDDYHTDKWRIDEGVGCESCHGPGGDYWKMSVMKDKKQALANGLNLPDKETCLKCHNEKSPFYKPFDFEERWAEIQHDNPLTPE